MKIIRKVSELSILLFFASHVFGERIGWISNTRLALGQVQPVATSPHARGKSQWVCGVFRNDTDQNFTIRLRTRSSVTAAFVLHSHDVDEILVDPDQREVVVLEDIGPFIARKGKVLARCQIDRRLVSSLYDCSAEASHTRRRLYFRVDRRRIKQVPPSDGDTWKLGTPSE